MKKTLIIAALALTGYFGQLAFSVPTAQAAPLNCGGYCSVTSDTLGNVFCGCPSSGGTKCYYPCTGGGGGTL